MDQINLSQVIRFLNNININKLETFLDCHCESSHLAKHLISKLEGLGAKHGMLNYQAIGEWLTELDLQSRKLVSTYIKHFM
ncbi:hypothetical protein [Fulvivirga imtechensis]|uniref:hypothetical protein n=1 Tax=Fulvivirga imtechensis TaxID=881893 RepID=UPI0002F23A51|nr:hypothetical protein [Fulvivirga imtechensis]